mmetsp:Transcript_9867/g.23977  ORF Transcript_9867/g.23977 Transcript_9867/m.23977 type:complete len:349 (-) Transcript_9867:256-1302(-)
MQPNSAQRPLGSTLDELCKRITTEVDSETQRLAAEREALSADRAKLAEEFRVLRERFEEERQAFEQEKALIASTNKLTGTKIKLDVGGTHYAASRTTLTSVPGSMLESMFSGRHRLEEDEDGRYFIDRDGATFKLVLEYLRSPGTFTLEGLSKREAACCVTEFDYFGLPSLTPPAPQFCAKMNACSNGYTAVSNEQGKCTVTAGGSDWTWAVGAETVADDAVWKVSVTILTSQNLMVGVVANASPQASAYQDPTFAGWYVGGHFYHASNTVSDPAQGWPGWQAGDEAIFRLNDSAHTLSVYLKRAARCFVFTSLQAAAGQWRVCICTYGSQQTIVFSPATDEEKLLLQ